MPDNLHPVTATRDHALDALRTLAVIGMMAAHTARLMPREVRPDWATGVLLIEPIIPSLFLLLVGLSLARSFTAAAARTVTPGNWYRRQLKRAGALWIVSFVFFTLELGVRLPDALLAGGILATIAYAIVLVGGLLALGRGIAPVAITLLLGTTLFVYLDASGLGIHPVNIGNAPFLPLWLFALMGAIIGLGFNKPQGLGPTEHEGERRPARKKLLLTLGVAAGAVACALIARYGLEALFSKPFGRSDAGRLVPAPLFTLAEAGGVNGTKGGGEAIHVGYYNLRPVLAAACFGLQFAAFALLGPLLTAVQVRLKAGDRIFSWIFALGCRALMAYILHLTLLALLIVFAGERQPLKTGTQGTLVWLGLIVICHVVSFVTPTLRRRNNNVQFGH